jgi:excinuclease ABC subunit B
MDPVMAAFKPDQIEKSIVAAKLQMESAAKELDFMRAARFRDEMNALKRLLETSRGKI